MIESCLQYLLQKGSLTRFAQKSENGTLINSVHGSLLIRVAGEHDANRLRSLLPDAFQKFDAVHYRHPHVGYDDGVRSAFVERAQPFVSRQDRIHVEAVSKLSTITFQDVRFVIDHQDLGTHVAATSRERSRSSFQSFSFCATPAASRNSVSMGWGWESPFL